MFPSDFASAARFAVLATILAAGAAAQPSNGYVFVAPGGYACCSGNSPTLHFGVGGEYVIGKGFGAGAEIGGVGMTRYFADSMLGVLSTNGYYHFKRGDVARADPFVTGGYTLMFRSGHANLANFGGGLNYWFHGRLGARVELRDHVNTRGSTAHFWGIRLGLAFR